MSLRVRLSIIISLVFLAGMVMGVSIQVHNAKSRVSGEVDSTARLAYELLQTLVPATRDAEGRYDAARLLAQLRAIGDVRHLDIRVENEAGPYDATPGPSGEEIRAPGWFVKLVRPTPTVQRYTLPTGDMAVVIRTNPADEIEEVWLESRNTLAVLMVVLLLINGSLFVIIGRWLRPVRAIVEGLEDVERGDLSGRVKHDQRTLPELRVIASKLNRLTSVLRESKAENDRLAKRSLMIQEEERRHLAQELHDEMGQSISAIKAIAFSLRRSGRHDQQVLEEGVDRIAHISNQISDRVRNMMGRLRPANLDELGLVAAVEHMVDEWNDHHQDCFCRFRSALGEQRLGDDERINLYRIIQEGLTNVARHAQADTLLITLDRHEGQVSLEMQDNGRGFDTGVVRWGMGLSGMRERVEALGGSFSVRTAPGEGVRIHILVPDNERS